MYGVWLVIIFIGILSAFLINMKFYGLKDFYANRLLYKTYYLTLNEEQIEYYKRFVYSISFENEYVKDVIWEYLNDDDYAEEVLDKLYFNRINRRKK